jgi:hypothetical protein
MRKSKEELPPKQCNGVAFIGHDPESLVKIPIEPLDQHGIVVATAKVMAVDQDKVECLVVYPEEFDVFVKDTDVAKAKK